jgi:hypothetical protein
VRAGRKLFHAMKITKPNTWLNLYDFYATNHLIPIDFWYDSDQPGGPYNNPFYEPVTNRRFNQVSAKKANPARVRLIFLRTLLADEPGYKRLCHKDGRPVWAYDLKYEGVKPSQGRTLSFNLKGESKRFVVSERHTLFLEDDQYINPNHHFFMLSHRLAFSCFGNPFVADRCLKLMYQKCDTSETEKEFMKRVQEDSQIKIGSLVEVRMGLFAPDFKYRKNLLITMAEKYCDKIGYEESHPERAKLLRLLKGSSTFHGISETQEPSYIEFVNWCRDSNECIFPLGLVLRKDPVPKKLSSNGRESYTVKFGDLVYEELHPIQMEDVKNNV